MQTNLSIRPAATAKSGRLVLSAICVLLLAACAKPTPYQPAIEGYGFTQQRLEDNRFRINFSGNSVTPLPVVEDYMLFRAAEITVDQGYDYFEISNKDINKSTRYVGTYTGPIGGYYGGRRFPRYAFSTSFQTGTYRPINSYTTSANVLLFRGKKPADNPEAYDARDVISRLGPTIRRPQPAPG